jgi:hypothetical protein
MQNPVVRAELYARIPLLPDATRAVVFGVLSNERDVHGVVKVRFSFKLMFFDTDERLAVRTGMARGKQLF